MSNVKEALIKELKTWLWYAAISTIAAIYGCNIIVDRYTRTDVDINIGGMIGKMTGIYLVPFLGVFSVLSVVRIAIVCLWKRPAR